MTGHPDDVFEHGTTGGYRTMSPADLPSVSAEEVSRDEERAQSANGSATEWPDPDRGVLRQGRRPPPQLPLDVFGPWSSWLVDAAEGAGAPLDYTVAPLLCSAAALIGNTRCVSPWAGWREPCILWGASVGDPSSGKSPAADPVLDAVREAERTLGADFGEHHRDWETAAEVARAAREEWQHQVANAVKADRPAPPLPSAAVLPDEPQRPRALINDATIERLGTLLAANPRGLLHSRDELSGMLGNFDRYGGNGGDRSFWIECYGGRSYTIDRVKHGTKPIRVPRLAVSIFGGIQPDKLASALLREDDDGLAARFLWTWPDPVPPRRPTRAADPVVLRLAFERLLTLQPVEIDGEARPVVAMLAADAAALFQEWREEHHAENAVGMLGSAFGKAPGHVLRLALVLDLLWWSAGSAREPQVIGRVAVAAACGLMSDYFLPMAHRVFSDAALPKAERGAATVARWLLGGDRRDILNARKLRREERLPGLSNADDVKEALAVLVEAEWLRPNPSREGGTSGRQREDFAVNPKVWDLR